MFRLRDKNVSLRWNAFTLDSDVSHPPVKLNEMHCHISTNRKKICIESFYPLSQWPQFSMFGYCWHFCCFRLFSTFYSEWTVVGNWTQTIYSTYVRGLKYNSMVKGENQSERERERRGNTARESMTITRFGICKSDVKRVNSSHTFLKIKI